MARHRKHALKERKSAVHHHSGGHVSDRKSSGTRVFALHSKSQPLAEKREEKPYGSLLWPLQLFDLTLAPWNQWIPLAAWIESRRLGGRPGFPKAASRVSDKPVSPKSRFIDIA